MPKLRNELDERRVVHRREYVVGRERRRPLLAALQVRQRAEQPRRGVAFLVREERLELLLDKFAVRGKCRVVSAGAKTIYIVSRETKQT